MLGASQRPGSQYVSIRYTERLAEAGIEPSVGSRGDSYDNALAESINGLYKAEVIHRRGPWKTKAAVELATLEWVSWFNHRRLLEPIGYIPPAEAEANMISTSKGHAGMVFDLNNWTIPISHVASLIVKYVENTNLYLDHLQKVPEAAAKFDPSNLI